MNEIKMAEEKPTDGQHDKKAAKSGGMLKKFKLYCKCTSLHGFNFLAFPGQTPPRTIFWTTVLVTSFAGSLLLVGTNTRDFAASSVSYDLQTPTQPLDDVFFPSIVICNMNQLRSSFIYALINDPDLENTTYLEVHQLLEKAFVKVWSILFRVFIDLKKTYFQGQDLALSQKEEDLIDKILNSTTYNKLFDEIVKVGFGERTNDTVSNLPLLHHHRIMLVDWDNLDLEREKRDIFLNIAAQVL